MWFWTHLQIEPYDVRISPEMEQQVANLLEGLEIQPVPQVQFLELKYYILIAFNMPNFSRTQVT